MSRKTLVIGAALAVALSGWVVVWTGFDVRAGAAQPEGVFTAMRICFSLIPAVGSLLALAAIRGWPLTRDRCREIRSQIEQKRGLGEPG